MTDGVCKQEQKGHKAFHVLAAELAVDGCRNACIMCRGVVVIRVWGSLYVRFWVSFVMRAGLPIRILGAGLCFQEEEEEGFYSTKRSSTSFGQPTRLITCANHGNDVICS